MKRIMYDFIQGEIDVLVATTIIETGMDISNVNTIIIHDADNMGLSQLYQLREAVWEDPTGQPMHSSCTDRTRCSRRSQKSGFTPFREYSDLGSGFKIAMRDMEIRGVGTLLGQRQHGHMQAVGYNLYCKMLK